MTIVRELNSIEYENKSDAYLIKERSYKYQYAPLYSERLTKMRNELKRNAEKKWNESFKNLVDIVPNETCIIIGTLYKEMKNKPNILKEITAASSVADDKDEEVNESNAGDQQQMMESLTKTKSCYIDESDQLILEDELQRIELYFPKKLEKGINKNTLCTGMVIALLGRENEQSRFEVDDYCFKETRQTKPTFDLISKTKKEPKYIMFMSGIELGDSKAAEQQHKLQLLIDYISGDFINTEGANITDQEKKIRDKLVNTVRLVIAGNSLSASTQSKSMHNKAKYLTKNFVAGSVNAMKQLDGFIEQLSSKITVDLMPGEFDPSNLMLPQQPLNNSMFTLSKNNYHKTFFTPTNPYRFVAAGVEFLGTSGQFVNDIRRTTSLTDSIEIMEFLMKSGHMAPTCPDTLACYPYYGQDPFILDSLPNVFFAANQPEFKHGLFHIGSNDKEVVHLITVPSFKQTASCVLFNLSTFQCEEITF